MERLRAQGKIRAWGLSLNTFQPAPEAEYMINHRLGQGFQLVLNIINQRAVPLLESMQAAGYGVIARMPLQFGLLSGKFTPASRFLRTTTALPSPPGDPCGSPRRARTRLDAGAQLQRDTDRPCPRLLRIVPGRLHRHSRHQDTGAGGREHRYPAETLSRGYALADCSQAARMGELMKVIETGG